jgi:hypothetical protein
MDLALHGREALQQDDWQQAGEDFDKALETGRNSPTLRRQIAAWCRNASTNLPGKTIELTGTTTDGASFDLDVCEGGLTLIELWPTSSEASRAEQWNVWKNYKLYGDRGFHVIDIGTAEDRQRLQQRLDCDRLPWITIDATQVERLHPLLRYCGGDDRPLGVLVDAEGRVVSTEAYGGELDTLLEELLGPPFSPTGNLAWIDLEPVANAKLGHYGGSSLEELPQGEQTLGGVQFRIADAMVRLAGRGQHGNLPEKVEGISIAQRFDRLYLLHGVEWGTGRADGTTIGHYRVRYEDRSTEEIPIVLGEDVRCSWNLDQSKAATRGRVVWTGMNVRTRSEGVTLRLYLSVWENPHPDKIVAQIDCVSTMTRAGPFCVAMTVEGAVGAAPESEDAPPASLPEESRSGQDPESPNDKTIDQVEDETEHAA